MRIYEILESQQLEEEQLDELLGYNRPYGIMNRAATNLASKFSFTKAGREAAKQVNNDQKKLDYLYLYFKKMMSKKGKMFPANNIPILNEPQEQSKYVNLKDVTDVFNSQGVKIPRNYTVNIAGESFSIAQLNEKNNPIEVPISQDDLMGMIKLVGSQVNIYNQDYSNQKQTTQNAPVQQQNTQNNSVPNYSNTDVQTKIDQMMKELQALKQQTSNQ